MARPKKVRLHPPETESQLRDALQAQVASTKIEQAETFQPESVVDKVTKIEEVKPVAETKQTLSASHKVHKTWNHHMHTDAKGFYQAMKGKWDKLTDPDLLMVNTEGNLVGAVAKRYEMPEEMAQMTVSEWMKSL